MANACEVINIYSSELDDNHENENENENAEQIRRVNASINQDYSKNHVRISIKIPRMKTSLNWRKFNRNPNNGITTKVIYDGTRVNFEFILNQGKPTEIKYEYSSREPFRGRIEENRSYLKYKDEYVIWFIHKVEPW